MSEEKDHLDNPLVENEGSTPFGQPVIDFANIRVAYGLPKFHHKICKHQSLVYSRQERRIWCKECESTVDGFEAFMTITSHFHEMERSAQHRIREAQTALDATIVKRAAKHLDKAWNRRHPMAVCCPHCHGGILPEDFLDGGRWVSREIEVARRNRKGDPS